MEQKFKKIIGHTPKIMQSALKFHAFGHSSLGFKFKKNSFNKNNG